MLIIVNAPRKPTVTRSFVSGVSRGELSDRYIMLLKRDATEKVDSHSCKREAVASILYPPADKEPQDGTYEASEADIITTGDPFDYL